MLLHRLQVIIESAASVDRKFSTDFSSNQAGRFFSAVERNARPKAGNCAEACPFQLFINQVETTAIAVVVIDAHRREDVAVALDVGAVAKLELEPGRKRADD